MKEHIGVDSEFFLSSFHNLAQSTSPNMNTTITPHTLKEKNQLEKFFNNEKNRQQSIIEESINEDKSKKDIYDEEKI